MKAESLKTADSEYFCGKGKKQGCSLKENTDLEFDWKMEVQEQDDRKKWKIKNCGQKILCMFEEGNIQRTGEDICYKERENVRVGKRFPLNFFFSYLSP